MIAVGVFVTSVTAIVRGMRAAARWARVWDRFFREWFGEPEDQLRGEPRKPGIPERLGEVESSVRRVDDHVRRVDGRVQQIDHEMHPNEGGSLRDAVNRIERSTSTQQPTVHQTFVTPGDTNQADPHHSEE